MGWARCIEEGEVYKTSPDRKRAESMINMAVERAHFANGLKITDESAGPVFEMLYSSAVEIISAILMREGYAAKGHVCLAHFLKDVMKKEDLFALFDSCRSIRNDRIYRGKDIDSDILKRGSLKLKRLIEEVEQWR